MPTTFESEVKLACDDLGRLHNAGFELTLVENRHFEANWLLDSADQMLLKKGATLRIRSVDGNGWITYKGEVHDRDSLVKIREEIEADTSEPARLIQVFERLGFRRAFRYQKYRTTYALTVEGNTLQVVFDETPMGHFIEIEGEPKSITVLLEAAGFSAGEIVKESYPELQASRCKQRGVPLEDLVFG